MTSQTPPPPRADQRSRANLLAEGIAAEDIVVTGNTVIDALLNTVGQKIPFADPQLEASSEWPEDPPGDDPPPGEPGRRHGRCGPGPARIAEPSRTS